MYIKESELRALVRETFSKLIKEDARGLKHKSIAQTAANFLITKHGEALSFMEQDELKRKILDAVIDQMRNARMAGSGLLPPTRRLQRYPPAPRRWRVVPRSI